jgi:hypothetical protein
MQDQYDDTMLHRLAIFHFWSQQKTTAYFNQFPTEFRENPLMPPRKGIPPGQEYDFSLAKYEGATRSVMYGTKFKGYKLQDVLAWMDHPPTLGLFKTWRTERRFKDLVEKLKREFATYMAGNIVYEQFPPPLPEAYTQAKKKGLERKISFIRESLLYSPDLLARISTAISEELISNSVLDAAVRSTGLPKRERKIGDYLGYYVWVITLLYSLRRIGEKNPKRSLWIEICKKAIGCHWRDPFLTNYLKSNIPQKTWFFEVRSEAFEEELDRGIYMFAQGAHLEEFGAILKIEMGKLETGTNDLVKEDLQTMVDFLTKKIEFFQYGF